MSAEAGLVLNLTFFAAISMVCSIFVDKLVPIVNKTCAVLSCFQDGINTFGMLLFIWGILLPIMWLVCLINYLITKNNAAIANQEV